MSRIPKRPIIKKTIISPIQVVSHDTDDAEYLLNNPYECCACSRRYSKQEDNFFNSASFTYIGNGGYVTICIGCAIEMFNHYLAVTGNSHEAIERLCRRFDVQFDKDEVTRLCSKNLEEAELVTSYFSSSVANRLYDDDIYAKKIERENRVRQEEENRAKREEERIEREKEQEQEREKANSEPVIPPEIISRWGAGVYQPNEYLLLDEHYQMLKSQNPNCDSNQEIFIKDLCTIKLQQQEAIKSRSVDDFKKLTELYRNTFKDAGLRMKEETIDGSDEVLGVTLAVIGQYTPEEYYKDKKRYIDFDGIKEYIERYVLRPLRNLMHGTKEDDIEFCIKDGDDNE